MKIIIKLEELCKTQFSLLKDSLRLFKLEAELAYLNIFSLISYLCLLIPFIVTCWISFVVLIGYLLYPYIQNIPALLTLMLIINSCLIIIIGWQIKNKINQMCFSKTRNAVSLFRSDKRKTLVEIEKIDTHIGKNKLKRDCLKNYFKSLQTEKKLITLILAYVAFLGWHEEKEKENLKKIAWATELFLHFL